MAPVNSKLLEENIKFWEERYQRNANQWHIDDVHPTLIKYLPKLIGEVSNPNLKIFVPLCGKTKDIPFLLNLGYQVFAVEAVSTIIEELGAENNLKLTFSEKSSTYGTEDGNLTIYCGDFFTCPIENFGPFDCIWDRASLIAIDYPLVETYIQVMKKAVAVGTGHNFNYLLLTASYDKEQFKGIPRSVDNEDVSKYFESWTNICQLEYKVAPEDSNVRKVTGNIDCEVYEGVYLFTKKD